MKVFISWSGPLSQKVACALRDWIPCVLQYVRPYVSSEDIDKGARWSADVAKELSDSAYGILCVTADNQAAPWLNFEAGALSKAIDKSYVTPFLLNLKAAELKNGPLIQFQATAFSHDEVRKLVESLNQKAADAERVEIATVRRTFDKWWPELEKDLSAILQATPLATKVSAVPTKQESMIEELLDIARSQQRHFGNPEMLLPPDYLEWVLQRSDRRELGRFRPGILNKAFHSQIIELIHLLEELEGSELQQKALKLANRLHDQFHVHENPVGEDGPVRRIRRQSQPLSTVNSEASDKK